MFEKSQNNAYFVVLTDFDIWGMANPFTGDKTID